jgi:hypothetical protein
MLVLTVTGIALGVALILLSWWWLNKKCEKWYGHRPVTIPKFLALALAAGCKLGSIVLLPNTSPRVGWLEVMERAIHLEFRPEELNSIVLVAFAAAIILAVFIVTSCQTNIFIAAYTTVTMAAFAFAIVFLLWVWSHGKSNEELERDYEEWKRNNRRS